jgi:hypothetical protein
MDKKIEHLITIGMIAGLVAVFFYQVAYGYSESYNIGFKIGIRGNFELGNACQTVTNGTACGIGWTNGWQMFCKRTNQSNPNCPNGTPLGFNKPTDACTGLCASNPYQYGFQMGKRDGLANYMSLDDSCAMYGPHRWYSMYNKNDTISHIEPSKEIQCGDGYTAGWNAYCHIGAKTHPQPDDEAAPCPSN